MENINKKKYWLRGGMSGIFLLFLPFLYLQFKFGWEMIDESIAFEIYLFLNKLPLLFSPSTQFVKLCIAFVIYFSIGMIFGWLYGKIKNRKT
jgi:hypothetical protein